MKSTAFPNVFKEKEFPGGEGGGKLTASLLKAPPKVRSYGPGT